MFVAGIQLVVSRPITLRATLIIGLSLLSSLSVLLFPEFYDSLPSWTRQFTGSEITMMGTAHFLHSTMIGKTVNRLKFSRRA